MAPAPASCAALISARSTAKSLTQNPTSPNHRLPLTAFETHSGRSIFAAETALPAPLRTLPLTDRPQNRLAAIYRIPVDDRYEALLDELAQLREIDRRRAIAERAQNNLSRYLLRNWLLCWPCVTRRWARYGGKT